MMSNTLEFETLDASFDEIDEIQRPPEPEEAAAAKPLFLAAVERARKILASGAATDLSNTAQHYHGGHSVEEAPAARPAAGDSSHRAKGRSLRRKLV